VSRALRLTLWRGLLQRTNDLAQEWERLGYPHLPEQPTGNHNALNDAQFNYIRALTLDAYAKQQRT